MPPSPCICVLIPVYNHGLTVGRVVEGASKLFPVIVVNDGSTDQTADALASQTNITVVTFPRNRGKAEALRAGFSKAEELGYTHAITIDADGQHSTLALAEFAATCRRSPDALIVGVRDLEKAAAPRGRRISNAISNFWFKFETGVALADTQCGYRCYPLTPIRHLHIKSARYAFELEILVKAAWAGISLIAEPVQADYAAPTSRLSHFHPWRDMAQISWLHSNLSTQAFCIPAPLRKLIVNGTLRHIPRKERLHAIFRYLFSEYAETPSQIGKAVGLGLFFGIAPIWGFQMLAAALAAHRLRLNKAIALSASNISIPPIAPFILAAGLIIGHFLWSGRMVDFSPEATVKHASLYFCEWVFGSFVLALLAGIIGGFLAYWAACGATARKRDPA